MSKAKEPGKNKELERKRLLILAFFGANALDLIKDPLTNRERLVLRMRYGTKFMETVTLREIAQALGYSGWERIRQIEAKALRKLCHPIRQEDYVESLRCSK